MVVTRTKDETSAAVVADQRSRSLPEVGCPSIREFLAGLAVIGASALLPGYQVMAQTPEAHAGGLPMKIDLYNHVMPVRYLEMMKQYSKDQGLIKRMSGLRRLWDIEERVQML